MKKTMIILSALLALVACNKEIPQNGGVIDPSKVVFNIKVQTADDAATKGVKTSWVDGDVVYVFFENNTDQYVKMTFEGSSSSWSYCDKDGGSSYTDLTLAEDGEHLSAVYMPGFVTGGTAPDYKSSKWTIGEGLGGYILKAETVEYSIYSREGNIVTLEATLNMTAPANLVQVYINESDPSEGNEYVLNMTNVKPFTFDGIVPGEAATITTDAANFPLPGYAGTLGSDPAGYYFWGILDDASAGAIAYNFQLVEQNAEKKYAISSKSKTVITTISGPKAVKLGNLTDNGKFVSMGYDGGPLWATGNLDKTYGIIVDPLLAGEFFMYGKITPYNSSDAIYAGIENPLSTAADVAFQTNSKWRIPTTAQVDALGSNTNRTWHSNWTTIGNDNGGILATSKVNGISLFLAAAGYFSTGTRVSPGDVGLYWSCSPYDSVNAYFWSISAFSTASNTPRRNGLPVRPVALENAGSGENFSWGL